MPMSRWCTGTWVRSRPPMTTWPSSGSSNPAIILSVVVLPQPDGPSSEKNSPGSTVSSTPATATTPPGKRLVTRSRRIEAGEAEGGGGIRPRALANAGAGVTCAARARLASLAVADAPGRAPAFEHRVDLSGDEKARAVAIIALVQEAVVIRED